MLNPVHLSNEIKKSYLRYLTTTFKIRNKKIRDLFNKEVENFSFINGPYLEATPPFKPGCYIEELLEENVLNKNFSKFIYEIFPYLKNNPLYLHQEKAIRKVTNNENVVVVSGTGSGKTECFLIPILNYLLNEFDKKTLNPGVRALLLYPMNALANDQLRRLRDISKIIEEKLPNFNFTFGRYIGETEEEKVDAIDKFKKMYPNTPLVRNELLSRDEMRENPPNILLTNYAMLEYLLLRPEDSPFFEGKYEGRWKFIVLDEAHIYKGAAGIEMGMLIRRLKERIIKNNNSDIRCIATGATLSDSNTENLKKVAIFASNLFGEKFNWDNENKDFQSVISSERIKISLENLKTYKLPLDIYGKFLDIIEKNEYSNEDLYLNFIKISKEKNISTPIINKLINNSNNSPKKYLHNLLSQDELVFKIRSLLESEPLKIEEILIKLFGSYNDTNLEALINLLNLSIWVKTNKDDIPIIPARFHLFVRAPEGLYITFYPELKVYLDRHLKNKDGFIVFAIATCTRCGQEYLVGDIINGKLQNHLNDFNKDIKKRYFLIVDKDLSNEEDEDEEVAIPEFKTDKGMSYKLCIKCGTIIDKNKNFACECKDPLTIEVIEILSKEETINCCISCGLRSINVIREFIFQHDAPAAVLSTSLFQNINKQNEKSQKLKKILIFSDSRQDAAFFAPYLSNTYNRFLYRSIILKVLEEFGSEDYRLESLVNDIYNFLEDLKFFDRSLDKKEKIKQIWSWVLQEFCALYHKICLEDVGLIDFKIIEPYKWEPPIELRKDPWDFSYKESLDLYQSLLNTLRYYIAITLPQNGPRFNDETFLRFSRSKEYKFRGEKSNIEQGIFSFLPTSHLNSRLEYIRKIENTLDKKSKNFEESHKLLSRIWEDISDNWVHKSLFQFFDNTHGALFQLDYKFWKIIKILNDEDLYICDVCGAVTTINIRGVCHTFGCNGKLIPFKSSNRYDSLDHNHYRFLYKNLQPISMSVHEHTAQLKTDYAAEIQQQFINNNINVLSCSTTFELGVDLGELETIFLRNIPPEPENYIQRSGRAGRRSGSIGFTLTFALLRSHDLNYFKDPRKMINGTIIPPTLEIYNEKIVRRHMHSVVLSKFFRENCKYFGTVNDFFQLDNKNVSGTVKLLDFLEKKPEYLLESLKKIIPENLYDILEIENWGWVKYLIEENGLIPLAELKLKEEYENLNLFYNAKGEELKNIIDKGGDTRIEIKIGKDRRWAEERKDTIKSRQLIDFLASNSIIPKYGFPVDVVELTLLSNLKEAKNITLERDLRIAISEFAPGSKVVANKYIWKSYGIKLVKNKAWPLYLYSICKECGHFNLIPSTDRSISEIKCKGCGNLITKSNVHRFITPIFGFVTNIEHSAENCTDSRPKKLYGTRPFFSQYSEFKSKDIIINGLKISRKYSRNGELVVICKGGKYGGFWICNDCGASFSEPKKSGLNHISPNGLPCNGTLMGPIQLGHSFKTDIVAVSFNNLPLNFDTQNYDLWFSILYALLEATSRELGIPRQDLDGCLNTFSSTTELILFDNVPSGAGQVKNLMEDKNFSSILDATYKIAANCNCGIETSCYSCLRNYQNQFCHDNLKRGLVVDFFKNINKIN